MLTFGQLKAEVAKGVAKNLPDAAAVTVNGNSVNGTVVIDLGATRDTPAGDGSSTESSAREPSFNIAQ